MATSGSTAWMKYFQGRGNVSTVVKKETPFLAGTRTINLKRGDKVTLIESDRYSPKMSAKHNNVMGTITFNSLAKPGVKSGVMAPSLKPQAFNIRDDIKYTIDTYINTVSESISERNDLSGELKVYLQTLIDHMNGKANLNQLKNSFNNKLPLNDINKDFGEVVGPIAIFKNNILLSKGIKINTRDKIYVPSRPNEPLLDYGIYQGDKLLSISAKSGKTTNTVKPADLINLLSNNPAILRKWQNTLQFKVFEKITAGDTISGPLMAAALLSSKYKEFQGITDKAIIGITKRTKIEVIEKNFASYLVNNTLIGEDIESMNVWYKNL